VHQLLTGAGFTSIEIDPIQAPMWFGAGLGDAYAFALGLLGWMLDGLDEDRRTQALGALRATIDAHSTADGVVYRSSAWLIRAGEPRSEVRLTGGGPGVQALSTLSVTKKGNLAGHRPGAACIAAAMARLPRRACRPG
jgi:hypothetical protein